MRGAVRGVTATEAGVLSGEAQTPVGSLAVALGHARRLLDSKPSLAVEQAGEILAVIPDNAEARLILGIAQRRAGDPQSARSTLTMLVARRPHWPQAHYELGVTLAAIGDSGPALAAMKRAIQLKPDMSDAWRALGDLHTLAGDTAAADAAYAQSIRHSVTNPVLMEAAAALVDNRLAVAERLLKDFLKRFPTDVAAIRMLAEVAARLGRFADASTLLARCLELAPGFAPARYNYAIALHRQGRSGDALPQIDRLLAEEPGNPAYRNLKAAALSQVGEYEATIALYAGVLRDYPNQPKVWMSYGHALKTAGRQQDGIAAYRESIAQAPGLGEAYWSLANLKTFRFTPTDIGAMRAQLARADLGDDDRLHFHFALGKALEDAGDFARSFTHYAEGNAIRHAQVGYAPEETTERLRRSTALFTRSFLNQRAEAGCLSPDPIFVVGLPRSGSTLIEQILSSHSAVEGTSELPEIGLIARALGDKRRRRDDTNYPELLGELPPQRLRELGEEYLARTRIQRKTDRPFFIDKTPQNFLHLGMIRLILPNAKIIDARRHPLAACFSGFKQHFARGQPFSYDLVALGRYYRDYLAMMAHFDQVAPGIVHRVIYETMVEDTEAEIRRLLAYCGLPFEDSCLRFHETDRAVRTASSEQVRRPIFRDGLDHWRNYEPWLGPLKASLGDALDSYPEASAFESG